MKSIRFSQVVEKCGLPEVYVLFARQEARFVQALKETRIMSLLPGTSSGHSDFGLVGYQAGQRGQLLLFPRSLKTFEGRRIIGVQYDLFSHERPDQKKLKNHQDKADPTPPAKKPKRRGKESETATQRRKTRSTEKSKVIPFIPIETPDEGEDEPLATFRGYARLALDALKRNNPVAASNLLKRMIGDAD